MKRTRAQQPKEQDPTAANPTNPKPQQQRRAKQPRQPRAASTKKKLAPAAAAAAASSSPRGEDMAPTVPDVCGDGGGGDEVGPESVVWDIDGGLSSNGSSWWTFGVEEEKLLGWFPFVEEDFRFVGGGRGADAEVAFDDDIWRIHQIYEIPNYAAK